MALSTLTLFALLLATHHLCVPSVVDPTHTRTFLGPISRSLESNGHTAAGHQEAVARAGRVAPEWTGESRQDHGRQLDLSLWTRETRVASWRQVKLS